MITYTEHLKKKTEKQRESKIGIVLANYFVACCYYLKICYDICRYSLSRRESLTPAPILRVA